MLPFTDQHSARVEYASLQHYCRLNPGETMRELIEIPEPIRGRMEAFCREHPRDAEDVQYALDFRDYLLELLEADYVPTALDHDGDEGGTVRDSLSE